MYSNERGSRFSLVDILLKLIFAALFIFVLIWLFNKNIPNMAPFYSNVFRENIKYMQEAGESYFTDDKMPKEIGETVKISLEEMFDRKLILPFVDEDGNSCNQYESYVSVTKTELGYELKTSLVCNNESDYTIKILGCHNYCKDKECEKVCTKAQITEYQYKKLATKTSTSYKCDKGYELKGKYCYKSVLVDSKSAEVTKTKTTTLLKDAKLVIESGTKVELDPIVTQGPSKKEKKYVAAVKTTTGGGTTTQKEAYDCTKTKIVSEAYSCTKTKTEQECTTKYKKEAYSCECSVKYVGGVLKEVCNTCYKSVPYQSCQDVVKEYTDTCYRDVEKTYTDTCYRDVEKEYVDTCYRNVEVEIPGQTVYSCPAIATGSEGSGASLKCYYYETVPGEKTYKCPSGTTTSEGTGANLKCYKVTSGKYHYECEEGYKLNSNNVCYKNVVTEYTDYECSDGYTLDGKTCKKYSTEKEKATAKKTTKKYYTYKWSEETSLSGWEKTGKTRIVEGEEICE